MDYKTGTVGPITCNQDNTGNGYQHRHAVNYKPDQFGALLQAKQRDLIKLTSPLPYSWAGPDTGPSRFSQILLSGGFGSGHREGVVGEVGDELQVPAECLDVAGDGLDG
jgi:hypothetical protein